MNAVFLEVEQEASNPESCAATLTLKEIICHPYVLRIALWALFLGLSIAPLCLLIDASVIWPNALGETFLKLCYILLCMGIVHCLWVRHCTTGEQRILLATIAFSGFMFSFCLHLSTSWLTWTGWHEYWRQAGILYFSIWKLALACLLIAAARNNTVKSKWKCRSSGLRTIIYALTGSLIIMGLLGVMLIRSGISIIALHHYVQVLPLIAFLVGLGVFIKRYIQDDDEFSDAIIWSALLAITGEILLIVSVNTYDFAWWASLAFGFAALLTLAMRFGTEFGTSYSHAQSRIEHLEAVHHISSRLSNTLDLRVVMLVLVSDITSMLSARFASVMLVDNSGEYLKTVATHGLPGSPLKAGEPCKIEGEGRPGFHSGHTARAFKEKRICVVNDIYTDVEFVPWRLLAQHNGYAVSSPLVYQDVALGVLNLFFDSSVPINDERIRLFETLSSAAAVSIANSQLYDKTIEVHETADPSTLLRDSLAA